MKKTASTTRKPQPSPETPRKRLGPLKERKLPGRRIVEVPDLKGRRLEKVVIYTSGEHHSIVIEFQDHTALDLEIDPGFTLRAAHEDRHPDHDLKILRRWPAIFSER